MLSVYLASRYSRRNELREHARILEKARIHVTSRWLHEDEPLQCKLGDHSPEFYQETALIDLEDVRQADVIVFFSEDPLVGTPRGGRHVEFGYALALGKKPIVIGGEENIFHYLPWVEVYSSLELFVERYAHAEAV